MTQLTLLPSNAWALDEDTKRIGRTGLASAREVLASKTAIRTMTIEVTNKVIPASETTADEPKHALAA